MKPDFALDFRFDSVSLLQRGTGGWHKLDSVEVTAPDLPQAMQRMRRMAQDRSGGQDAPMVKLILPEDQVLFTSAATPGPTATARRDQVERALIGRTPYGLDELVYDWRLDGDHSEIAAVARLTLQEAEDFALGQGFAPLAFAAVPSQGSFGAEAFFGPSDHAATLLADGTEVQRETEITRLLPDPVQKAAPPAEPAPAEAPVPALDEPDPAAPPPQPAPEADPDPEPAALPAQDDIAPPPQPGPAPADDPAAPQDAPRAEDADLPFWLGGPDTPPPAQDRNDLPDWLNPDDEAPLALDVGAEDLPRLTGVADPGIQEGTADPATETGFSSRRRSGTEAAAAGAKPALSAPSRAKSAPADRPADRAGRKPSAAAAATARKPDLGARLRSLGGARTGPAEKPAMAPVAAPADLTADGTALTGQTAPSRPKPGAEPGFKPRGGAAPTRGRPRYMLLTMTLILLVILALIAGWASYLAMNSDTAPTTQFAAEGTGTAAPAEPAPAPVPAPAETPAQTAPDPATEPAPEATAALPPAAPGTEAPAGPQTAASGQDEILLSTADTPPDLPQTAPAPAQLSAAEAPPAPQAAPPPFGTVYAFDDNGLIKPTPEGIVTPEGVLLFAGKPARLPPSRPAALTQPAATTPADPAAPTTEPAAAAAPPPVASPPDPSLEGKKPRPRPEAVTLPDDQAALPPASGPVLAGFSPRPPARPERLTVAAASEAGNPSTASALTATLQTAAASDIVTISRIPAPRPRDLERAVEAAVQAAIAFPTPEPEPPAKEAPAAQDHDDGEPEIALNGIPSGPSTKTVAKNATFRNAIDLGETNLIGVYGTENRRYALIRTESGRYKKVRVGDRVDGGQVAAITRSELRLQKGGRMLVLEVPGG